MNRVLRVLAIGAVLPIAAFAVQVFRVDPSPVMTTAGNAPAGGFPALYAVAGASINVCTDAACSIPATTYTDTTGGTTCPASAPVTLSGTSLCTPTTGPQGQFGFWLAPGTYYYRITFPTGQSFGNFPITSNTAGVTNLIGGTGISVNNGGIGAVTITNTGVVSFNGRTGAVVPTTGDYTAAQVTNAVDSTQTYSNPAWITALSLVKLTGLSVDTFLQGTAGNPQAGPLANCVAAGGVLQYSTSSHAFSCHTLASADIPAANLASSANGGVTGNLPVANLAGGSGASGTTFWRGDGTWNVPPGLTLPAGTQTQQLQIQPNTGNSTTYQWASKPALESSDYYWTQTTTGSITGGANSLITLVPVPLGVNWNDGTNDGGNTHQILITGGGGPSEVCYIVSAGPGTATSGSASGTLTIHCPTSHTSGATIQSNSNGIQEALYASSGGRIHIPTPAGKTAINIYGGTGGNAITIPCLYDWEIYGDGPGYAVLNGQTVYPQTTLALALQNGVAISALMGTGSCAASTNALNLNIHDLSFRGAAIGDGLDYGAAISLTGYLRSTIRHIEIARFDGRGIILSNSYSALIEDNYIVDNGRDGVYLTGSLANATVLMTNHIVNNCRVNGSTTCSNVTSDAIFIGLNFIANTIEFCGAHPWSGSVTVCNNLTVGGSGGNSLVVFGGYIEAPIGANGVNLYVGANITSGFLAGVDFLGGAAQFNYTAAANSYWTIGTNSFNKNACAPAGCGNAIWIPGDAGVKNHMSIAPQELIGGAAHVFGSAFVGEWLPYFSTAAPSFTPAAGDLSYNKTPAVGGVSEWRAVGTAWKPGSYVETLAPGTGALITAAATIAPTNYSHHITGATSVTTITVPTGWTLAPFGPGPNVLTLMCNTAVNFGSGGNVGGTPLVCPIGGSVIFTLDSALQVWNPSNVSYFPNVPVSAAVASAATVTATGPLFHVTGTAAIATINLPGGFTVGCINIVPDGAFTTTNAGNIAIASTAVLSKQLQMCYDPTTVKWYPSY